MDKKGELTGQQIVIIIILIISFAILLIFILGLGLKEQVDKESCRNSISLRGTALGKGTSLNCKTQNICLSAGGDCVEAGSSAVKLDVASEDEFKDKLSGLMYDCWYQMGEGKIDYLPTNFGFERNYCAICNRVYLDDRLKEESFSKIDVKEFYIYLADKKTPDGKQSMLNYFYGTNSIDSTFDAVNKDGRVNIDELKFDFTNSNGNALVTSLAKRGWGSSILSGAIAGLSIAAAVASGGSTGAIQALIIGGASGTGTGTLAGFLITGAGDTLAMPPSYYPYSEEDLKKIGCYEFTNLP